MKSLMRKFASMMLASALVFNTMSSGLYAFAEEEAENVAIEETEEMYSEEIGQETMDLFADSYEYEDAYENNNEGEIIDVFSWDTESQETDFFQEDTDENAIAPLLYDYINDYHYGACGDNLEWTYYPSETILRIFGTGDMYDYQPFGSVYNPSPWYEADLQLRITSIEVGDGMTRIGDCGFYACFYATSISIPNTVVTIGDHAFYDCYRLTSITIPYNVVSIGDYAFGDCRELTQIYFTGNAPSFASRCFNGITSTAYYPANNSSWTEEVMQNYGGTITWVAYDPETGEIVPDPTPVGIDKSDLQSEYDADVEMTNIGYSEDSWATYQSALNNASLVLADESATQDQVDADLAELQAAKAALLEEPDTEEPETESTSRAIIVGVDTPTGLDAAAIVDGDALLSDEDKELFAEGAEIEFVLTLAGVDSVSDYDRTLVEAALGDYLSIYYMDIELTKYVDGVGEEVTEANSPITITVTIPETMIEEIGSAKGSYAVIRVHENSGEQLAVTYNEDSSSVTFSSDLFSTYALAYVAGDEDTNIGLYVTLMGIAFICMMIAAVYFVRRRVRN